MRIVTLSVLGLASTAAAAVADAAIKTTQTVTKTIAETSVTVETSTRTVNTTLKQKVTVTSVSTAYATVTETQPTQTVTETDVQTVTQPASTVTNTETQTVTQPASTVTNTETQTATSTEVDTITSTDFETATLSASTLVSTVTLPALTVTMPASTITSVSTVTIGGSNSSTPISASSSSTTSTGASSSSSSSSTSAVTTTTPAGTPNYPQSTQWTATKASSVYAAAATALTTSPTSDVEGLAFDRFVMIWLENTDYSLASTDPNLEYLASLGITHNNYYGVTHPSQPNYVASHAGDHFGIDSDSLFFIDGKGISWGEYQESMPFTGFEGKAWVNQTTGANNYVRKHNPGVIFDSAAESTQRLSQMKNFSMFYTDLQNQQLPQWMFVTPNELNDGHDTGVTYAGNWARTFFEPLITNEYFWNNTLILVTFDESETYTITNNVYTFLLGGAVPESLVGTTDSNYYNHYSQISTVSANWGLPTLGRWDVGANVYQVVADATGDAVQNWTATGNIPALANMYFNQSYAGPFNSVKNTTTYPVNGNVYPVPNVNAVNAAGRTVLPSVVSQWSSYNGTYYTSNLEVNDGQHYPSGWCALSLTC